MTRYIREGISCDALPRVVKIPALSGDFCIRGRPDRVESAIIARQLSVISRHGQYVK